MWFSRLLHMHPWDVRRLSYVQVKRYAAWIDRWLEQEKQRSK